MHHINNPYREYQSDEILLTSKGFFRHAQEEVRRAGIEALFPGVTLSVLAVIHNYTKLGYKPVNDQLRNETNDPFTAANIRFLRYALSKINIFNGTVFRGVQLPNEVIKKYEQLCSIKKAYAGQFFLSSSKDLNTAIAFADKGNGQNLQKTLFYIESKTGRDIEFISDWGPYFRRKSEQEVLFCNDSRFLVTSLQDVQILGKTYVIIRQEEV